MTVFLVRRFFQIIIVLLLSSALIYTLFSITPGGPLDQLLQTTDPKARPSQADMDRQKKLLGLDKPWYLWYPVWLAGDTWLDDVGFDPSLAGERKGVLRGDWGQSWKVQRNVDVLD